MSLICMVPPFISAGSILKRFLFTPSLSTLASESSPTSWPRGVFASLPCDFQVSINFWDGSWDFVRLANTEPITPRIRWPIVVLCFNGGTFRRCGASSSEDSCVRSGAASSSLLSDSIAPAPPVRWLLVKSRSRDGSVGCSLSLSELSLLLASRGGMVVLLRLPARLLARSRLPARYCGYRLAACF